MDIIGRRKWWYALSLLIIIPGLISLFMNGLNQGIDFKGGSIFDLKFEQKVDQDAVRGVLNQFKLGSDAVIQLNNNKDGAVIRTRDVSQETRPKLMKAMEDKFGTVTVNAEDKVDPSFGKELLIKALYALIIASILIMIYIAFRFSDIKFGFAAIIAVLHDAFIVLGVFSIMKWEVDSSFVAAILTIIGYSIMDTIVIFDRFRENLRLKKKEESLEDIANKSILQTMVRSINTVLTVVFMLAALIIFGGGTTVVFIKALLIGVVSGAYSSIFNASPLWIDFKRLEKRKNVKTAKLA